MATPEVHQLFHNPIADHSFSADRGTLAVARDNVIQLYNRQGSNFTLSDELKGHDKLITGIDIAPRSGRIVTCSQGKQVPTTCILKSPRCSNKVQIATLTFGSQHQVASSQHLYFCASIAPQRACAGHRQRRSLLSDPAPDSSVSAISSLRMIGGSQNI